MYFIVRFIYLFINDSVIILLVFIIYFDPINVIIHYIFIRMNAPVMVELNGETDPLQIAMKELKFVFIYTVSLNLLSLEFSCSLCFLKF